MAGKVFISDMHDRDRVKTRLLVQQKQVPLNKNGKPYLALVLMDRSGTIEGRVWENVTRLADSFDSGDFLDIEATVVEFNNRLQLKISNLQRVDPDGIDPQDFLPSSLRDRAEMLARVTDLLDSIEDQQLRRFVRGLLADDDFTKRFSRAPAAKSIHHAYLGGLLEHTLAVMELCVQVAAAYPGLDRDLLLAGAFLHDVGKISELSSAVGFDYTDEGRLVGHLVLGVEMLRDWARQQPALPAETVIKLEHMILAHHGSFEFGSPRRPKTQEALVLHYLDELDAKLQAFRQVARRETNKRWSTYQRLFDRYLLLGKPQLAEPAAAAGGRPESPARKRSGDGLRQPVMAESLSQLRQQTGEPRQMTLDAAKKADSKKD